MNPSLLRMTTPRDLSFDLHIPVGMRDVFAERIKAIPEDKRNSWRFHVVRSGETLDGIAGAFHVRANDIATTNGLAAGGGLDAEDEIVIPVANAVASAGPQRYAVRRGDTLVTVADRFGVSVEDLRRWNHLSSNVVKPGSSLAFAQPVKLAPSLTFAVKQHEARAARMPPSPLFMRLPRKAARSTQLQRRTQLRRQQKRVPRQRSKMRLPKTR